MSWNGSDGKKVVRESPKRRPSGARLAAAGVILFILVVVAVWMIPSRVTTGGSDDGKKTATSIAERPAAIRPTDADESAKGAASAKTAPVQKPELDTVKEQLPSNVFRSSRGTVEMLAPPKSHESNGRKPIFDNEVHAMISNYIRPGVPMPPPEPVSDKAALQACIDPIHDNEDDDEYTREEKACVREMVNDLREYLKAGKSANEFFRDLEHRQEMEAAAVQMTRQEVLGLVREGRIDEAKQTLDDYNKILHEKNFPSVRVKQLEVRLKERQ